VLSLGIGVMLGAMVAYYFSHYLSSEKFLLWGWRIPFLISIIFGVITFYVRKATQESPIYVKYKKSQKRNHSPILEVFKKHKIQMLFAICIYMTVTVPFYNITTFMTTFLTQYVGSKIDHALFINFFSMFMFTLITPLAGRFSDIYGRKIVTQLSAFGILIFAYPCYSLLATGILAYQLFAEVVFALLLGCFFSPVPAILVELFPTSVRYTGISLSYNVGVMIFGANTPIIANKLINLSGGNLKMPAYYIIFAVIITLIALYLYEDKHNKKLI
jgi:MHS family proline/betaine transporter-like MFS transporter